MVVLPPRSQRDRLDEPVGPLPPHPLPNEGDHHGFRHDLPLRRLEVRPLAKTITPDIAGLGPGQRTHRRGASSAGQADASDGEPAGDGRGRDGPVIVRGVTEVPRARPQVSQSKNDPDWISAFIEKSLSQRRASKTQVGSLRKRATAPPPLPM